MNQQYEATASNGHARIKNVNSGSCLTASAATAGASITIDTCKDGNAQQSFSIVDGVVRGPGHLCLTYGQKDTIDSHRCKSGRVSAIACLPDCLSFLVPPSYTLRYLLWLR